MTAGSIKPETSEELGEMTEEGRRHHEGAASEKRQAEPGHREGSDQRQAAQRKWRQEVVTARQQHEHRRQEVADRMSAQIA